MINRVVLCGRLTRDPDLRFVGDGKPVVSFTIAVNRTFKNQNGETEADFINCVAWRNAENIAKFLKKGSMAGVDGRLQTRSYDDIRRAAQGGTRAAGSRGIAFLMIRLPMRVSRLIFQMKISPSKEAAA